MESEDNEAACVSSCETNSTESYGARQRSEESTSVDTQPSVSHRSSNSFETDAYNRRASLHLQSEADERVYSLSQKSSISSALDFSRHFASKKTDVVEGDDVSYADTFDSLDSLSESEDELQKKPSGDRSNSSGSQSSVNSNRYSSSGHRSSNSQLLSSHEKNTFIENRSKLSSSGAEDTLSSGEEDTRSPFSGRLEAISCEEGGIRSLSPDEEEDHRLLSLGISSDSSVWSPSDQNTTDHSVEDKFTSADGEIIYYSDFSIEALTARQYTQRSQRSDVLEWSQNLKTARLIPESEEFVQKKIQLLKQRFLYDKTETPSMSSFRSRNTEKDFDKVESVELKDFCSKKCRNLKNYRTDSGACKSLSSEGNNFYGRLKDDSDVITYGIPFTVVQRLRIDTKSNIDFHEPSACDRCRQKLGELGLSEFLQSKMAIAREQLTKLKLTDAKYASTYGMTVIGEILLEASCLSCKPELVMQRLLEPLNVKTISTETITLPA